MSSIPKLASGLLICLVLLNPLSSRAVDEMVMVKTPDVSGKSLAKWKKEKFSTVVLLVDDLTSAVEYAKAAGQVRDAGLNLDCFIEVARSPLLADAHPNWMASIGMHDDWLSRFPNFTKPAEHEVVKAYPWVTIRTDEGLRAQIERVNDILRRFEQNYDGVFLNDLQGPPSSCGCGNLLCRWATDYHVPATGTKNDPIEVAGQFIDGVLKEAWGKKVIPVWTVECQTTDLPKDKQPNTTGLCGGVGCAASSCPKEFRAQYAGLRRFQKLRPIGLLALHKTLERDKPNGEGLDWISKSVAYLKLTTDERQKPWIIIQGYDVSPQEEHQARKSAGRLAQKVIVARTPIEQSFQPRIVPTRQNAIGGTSSKSP